MNRPSETRSKPDSLTLKRNLIFVSGKGGVGKTVVSQAIASALATPGKRVLWVAFEDPTRPAGELVQIRPGLWHFNCEATQAFEEYAGMKIGIAALTRIFLQNKLMRYLAKAAPGIHELVLLGKVWHDRTQYDHVVVDMPSTGYGLAMFQSTENFARLFKSGPLYRDAEDMLATFRDPLQTGLVIVGLPEEMPLQEAVELKDLLAGIFPKNPPAFFANRRFPRVTTPEEEAASDPDQWPTPFAVSAADYARKRSLLEKANLRIWEDQNIPYWEIDYIPPRPHASLTEVAEAVAVTLKEKAIL